MIVKSGTATFYLGDDPTCTPDVVQAGSGSVDEGGGDVHVVRNEGSVDLVTVVASLIPAGMMRRMTNRALATAPLGSFTGGQGAAVGTAALAYARYTRSLRAAREGAR